MSLRFGPELNYWMDGLMNSHVAFRSNVCTFHSPSQHNLRLILCCKCNFIRFLKVFNVDSISFDRKFVGF